MGNGSAESIDGADTLPGAALCCAPLPRAAQRRSGGAPGYAPGDERPKGRARGRARGRAKGRAARRARRRAAERPKGGTRGRATYQRGAQRDMPMDEECALAAHGPCRRTPRALRAPSGSSDYGPSGRWQLPPRIHVGEPIFRLVSLLRIPPGTSGGMAAPPSARLDTSPERFIFTSGARPHAN